jgi:hypothetical protein
MMGNLALVVPPESGELLPSWQGVLAGDKSGGGTLRRDIGVRGCGDLSVTMQRQSYAGAKDKKIEVKINVSVLNLRLCDKPWEQHVTM